MQVGLGATCMSLVSWDRAGASGNINTPPSPPKLEESVHTHSPSSSPFLPLPPSPSPLPPQRAILVKISYWERGRKGGGEGVLIGPSNNCDHDCSPRTDVQDRQSPAVASNVPCVCRAADSCARAVVIIHLSTIGTPYVTCLLDSVECESCQTFNLSRLDSHLVLAGCAPWLPTWWSTVSSLQPGWRLLAGSEPSTISRYCQNLW